MYEDDISVLVTVEALFPGASASEAAMLDTLKGLSRDDALFTCARINAVVSGFGPEKRHSQRQTQAAGMLCSMAQRLDVVEYAARHGGPERVVLFFRGQMLELARWIVLHCDNQPGDGET